MPAINLLDIGTSTFFAQGLDHRSVSHGRTFIVGLLVATVASFGMRVGPALPMLRIRAFSTAAPADTLPQGWKQVRFGQNDASTEYELVRFDTTVVVKAQSSNGASGLITRDRVHLPEYPVLTWRWKVDGVLENGDVTKKEIDDAPARIYVTFDYQDLSFFERLKLMLLRRIGYAEAPSRALNYVWANHPDRGTAKSPYTDQIVMIPVQKGHQKVGRWIRYRRNVWEDYRRVFGEDPPPVNGIAIMTDTDNTGGETAAWYGDIVFRSVSNR